MQMNLSHRITLEGVTVEYSLRCSRTAKKMRVRVAPGGMTVTLPTGRELSEVEAFLREHSAWIRAQWERIGRLRSIRRPQFAGESQLLYRGEQTPIRLEESSVWRGATRVTLTAEGILLLCSENSGVSPARSLENWLRKQARNAIETELSIVTPQLNVTFKRIYLMEQRTKWGNCSALGNLSFNWRLILAPPYVLRYLVVHEAAHLAIPDHSRKFWLTVQSICPETERARQWLSASTNSIWIDLKALFPAALN